MVIGVILGLLIALLIAACLLLKGQNLAYLKQVSTLSEELHLTRATLGRAISMEQERQRLKESITVHFTEEQITTFASRVGARCKTIFEAEQQSALGKLD